MTSFDVVAILRKALGVKKIGHLGTLDPMATGVLPIAIGKATRLIEYLDGSGKEYQAKIFFGTKTDTDDIWGEVLEERDASRITEEDVRRIIPGFLGEIEQIPPMYAAIKVDGKKLYEYARDGKSVELRPRRVVIEGIDLMGFDDMKGSDALGKASAELLIRCSKGTYIRALARDMGEKLGVFGTMSGLVRRRSGVFDLEGAIDIEALRGMEPGEIEKYIIDCKDALAGYPTVTLGEWEAKLFSNGVKLRNDQWTEAGGARSAHADAATNAGARAAHAGGDPADGAIKAVFDRAGELIGIGRSSDGGVLVPEKVLNR